MRKRSYPVIFLEEAAVLCSEAVKRSCYRHTIRSRAVFCRLLGIAATGCPPRLWLAPPGVKRRHVQHSLAALPCPVVDLLQGSDVRFPSGQDAGQLLQVGAQTLPYELRLIQSAGFRWNPGQNRRSQMDSV